MKQRRVQQSVHHLNALQEEKKKSVCEQRWQARGKMSRKGLKYHRQKHLWEEKSKFGTQQNIIQRREEQEKRELKENLGR